MQVKSPPMTRQHYEFIADIMGPQVAWPSHLHSIADALESTNVRFNRVKFIERATKAWEDNYEPKEIDDEIIY
tara:strand:- start:726 stop:944 length:219 start_codon:yes stop_codon:yes gene_type:complete